MAKATHMGIDITPPQSVGTSLLSRVLGLFFETTFSYK